MSSLTRIRRAVPIDEASHFHLEAGTWYPITLGEGGRRCARLACPGCGTSGTLEDHEIDDAGNVTPSVACSECSYHEVGVVLEGWP